MNDQELDLFSFLKQRIETENVASTNNHDKIDKKKKDLRNRIELSIEKYRDDCRKMCMATYLTENGNELYKMMLAKNKIDHGRIKKWDVLYISKFFDAVKWWQDNEKQYAEISAAASILLGKPTHNGFQERVFSRGTYSDTKLRKRLKEEHFEMSVLNAINGKQIDELYDLMKPTIMEKEMERQELLKDFLEKRSKEPDLTKVGEVSSLNDKPDDVPEFASVCSENTIDMMSDDEDDINDELSMENGLVSS